MEFKLGQLVTVWVEDLDPIHCKRWKDKYGFIEEITFTEQGNGNGKPDFIKVCFPGLDTYNHVEFITDRIKPVEENNA